MKEQLLMNGRLALKLVPAPVVQNMTFGRSNCAVGRTASKMLFMAGLGATVATYPTNFIRTNIDGSGAVTTALGASYTWNSGCQIGSDLYFADGHDGAYKNTFRKINIDSGSPVSLAATTGSNRHSSVLVNVNNTHIFRGLGYNGRTLAECALYNIATNTWSALPNAPTDCNGVTGHYYNGKVYIMFGWSDTLASNRIRPMVFDIANNTWSQPSNSINTDWWQVGISWGQSAIVGKYIYYFQHTGQIAVKYPEIAPPGSGNMMIIRYDIENDVYAYAVTTHPYRTSGSVYYDAAKDELTLISGMSSSPGSANYETLARYTTNLIFKRSDIDAAMA